jgi:hypothetical protein
LDKVQVNGFVDCPKLRYLVDRTSGVFLEALGLETQASPPPEMSIFEIEAVKSQYEGEQENWLDLIS